MATINNENRYELAFIPVDNHIPILRNNGNMDNRCDMLIKYDKGAIFVELKDQDKHWRKGAIGQLFVTIKHFNAAYDTSTYTDKRAYASNKRHPRFSKSDSAVKNKFKKKTGFRLFIEANIDIK